MAAGLSRAAAVLVVLLLACPMASLPGYGFDALRVPAVLGTTALLLAVAFLRAARRRDLRGGRAPLLTAAGILAAVSLASLAVGRSAADGLPTFLLMGAGIAVLAVARSGLLPSGFGVRVAPAAIAVVGALVAAIGILQQFRGGEAVSLEGNRNYAGTLAGMLVAAVAAFACAGEKRTRLLAAGALALLVPFLALTQSRAGALGAAAGLAVALGGFSISRRTWTPVLVGALLVGALAALFGMIRPASPERMESADFRTEVWKSGARMALARPWLGWGLGSFSTEYPPFRSEAEFRGSHKYDEDAFREVENAHSSWVQAAVETGAPGLLAWLLLLYVAARLWRYYLARAEDAGEAAALAGWGGGLAAFVAGGAFNTLTVHASHLVLFWLFLGMIEQIGLERAPRRARPAGEAAVALPAAGALAALFAAVWTLMLASSDRAFTEGMQTADPAVRERLLRESLEANPRAWRSHYELARTFSATMRFPQAAEEGKATLALRPHHVDALNQTAICRFRSGVESAEAERDLKHAIEVAPYYYKSYFNLGIAEGLRGAFAESRRRLTESIERNPRHAPSYYYRGSAWVASGDLNLALEDCRKAKALGFDVAGALKADHAALEKDARFAELFK